MNIYPSPYSKLDFTKKASLGLPTSWITSDGCHLVFEGTTTPVRLIGTNVTDWACFHTPDKAVEYATKLQSRGYNCIRLHHIDRVLNDNPHLLEQLGNFVLALSNRGMRVAIDLYSKGREHIEGNDGFKHKVLTGDPEARKVYEKYIDFLIGPTSPLYQNKTIAFINPLNEGAHLVDIATLQAFYDYVIPLIRSYGFGGVILSTGSETNLGWDSAKLVGPIKNCHFYGDHPRTWVNEYYIGNMVANPWQWNAQIDLFLKQLCIVEEYAMLPFSPYRAANVAMLAAEFSYYKVAGSFGFCWADGPGPLSGENVVPNWYSLPWDTDRVAADTLAVCLTHYDNKNYCTPQRTWADGNYKYVSEYASVTTTDKNCTAYVSTVGMLNKSRGGFLFQLQSTEPTNFSTIDVDPWWKKVTNLGSLPLKVSAKTPIKVPISTRVTSAYALDPYTGEVVQRLVVYGNQVTPITPITWINAR